MAKGEKNNTSVLEFLFLGPLFSINQTLQNIRRDLKVVATQADVDNLTKKVTDIGEQQSKALGEVVSEFQKLKDQLAEAGTSVDLSGLSGAIDKAAQGAQALDDLNPDPPVTDPTPPTDPILPPPPPDQPSSPGEPVVVPEEPAAEDDSDDEVSEGNV